VFATINKSSHTWVDTVDENHIEEVKEYSAQEILKIDYRLVEKMIFTVKNPDSEDNESEIPQYV
jgi:hypothetical protein